MDAKDMGEEERPRTKPTKRRRFSLALKREMVEATLDGKTSVSVVARQYDVNANQLFRWRSEYRNGLLGSESVSATLLPVKVTRSSAATRPGHEDGLRVAENRASLEITLAAGHRVVVRGVVCQHSLQSVLKVLMQ
ncbi:MAG: transposase [Burkholderiales bacterium]|nr:transposase [Burkholderiales bacterium]